MMELLPPWPLLSAFLVASVALAITPGPAVLYIVARTVSQGRQAGLASVAGVALGNLGNVLGASVGLGALFAASSMAFTVVKYAGALYLIFLGVQLLRASGPGTAVTVPEAPLSQGKVFRDGFVVALLNPKTTLFYAAFLPQFMVPSVSPMAQTALLGSVFVAIAAVTDALYAIGAGSLRGRLSKEGRFVRHSRFVGGATFVGLGVFTAVSRVGVER